MRPASRTVMAILNPSPSWPETVFRRAAMVIKNNFASGEARMPKLSSFTLVGAGLIGVNEKALTPLCFSGVVMVKRRI